MEEKSVYRAKDTSGILAIQLGPDIMYNYDAYREVLKLRVRTPEALDAIIEAAEKLKKELYAPGSEYYARFKRQFVDIK